MWPPLASSLCQKMKELRKMLSTAVGRAVTCQIVVSLLLIQNKLTIWFHTLFMVFIPLMI